MKKTYLEIDMKDFFIVKNKYRFNNIIMSFFVLEIIEELQLPVVFHYDILINFKDDINLSYYYAFLGFGDTIINKHKREYFAMYKSIYNVIESFLISSKKEQIHIINIKSNSKTIVLEIKY